MSEADFALLNRAAEALWPEAVISNSGIVLGLARLAAKQTLAGSTSDGRRKSH